MRVFSRHFLYIVILVAMGIVPASSARSATVFSNGSLNGSYGFLLNKWAADPNALQIAQLGVMTFDGAGQMSCTFTSVLGFAPTHTVATGPCTGTYVVSSDGTATVALTSGANPLPQFAIVLGATAANVAHEIEIVQSTDNTDTSTISGSGILQSKAPKTWTTKGLKGSFAVLANEWTSDAALQRGSTVLKVTFDGKGHVTYAGTSVFGNVAHSLTNTGTYVVNPDGSGTVSFSPNADPSTVSVAFVLNNNGKGIQLVNATSTVGVGTASVISGAGVKQ